MAGITTYGDISQRTAAYAAVQALVHAQPILVATKFGVQKDIPPNTADNVKFRRSIPFAVTTTTLIEGVTPGNDDIRYEDVSVTLNQYGGKSTITDRVHDTSEDPALADATVLAGEKAAEVREHVCWETLRGGSNVFYDTSAHTARNTVDDVITTSRQRAITRFMHKQRARPILNQISATPKFGTAPVAKGIYAFCHTDLSNDIRQMTGFAPKEEYAAEPNVDENELGKVEDVRYILSPLFLPFEDAGGTASTNGVISTSGTSADVYPVIYVAKDSYGHVALKGRNTMRPFVYNPGKPMPGDELGQRGFVSWKYYYNCVRLNEAWIVRGEFAATDL